MARRKRDYAKEYRDYHGTPEQIARRSGRNKARRLVIKKRGKVAVRGKDVDHRDFNPTNNNPSNLRIMARRRNRARQPKRD